MIGRLCNYYYLSKFLCLEQSYILQLLLELVGSLHVGLASGILKQFCTEKQAIVAIIKERAELHM